MAVETATERAIFVGINDFGVAATFTATTGGQSSTVTVVGAVKGGANNPATALPIIRQFHLRHTKHPQQS